jgi:hypothetical protein
MASGDESDRAEAERRRRFLKNCAKFAAGTPPAVALLLSASKASATHNAGHSNDAPPCSIVNPGEPPPCD